MKMLKKVLGIAVRSLLCLLLVLVLIFGILCTGYSRKGEHDPARADWMKELPDGMTLSEINLPGSHDSGCFANNILSRVWWQTQWTNETIFDQLEAGLRVFDIRLRPSEKDPSDPFGMELNHDIWTCRTRLFGGETLTLSHVMEDAARFLEAHPTETAVLLLTDEVQGNAENRDTVKAALIALQAKYPPSGAQDGARFGGTFVYYAKGSAVPSLGDVRGKCILLDDYGTLTKYENHWEVFADEKIGYLKTAFASAGTQEESRKAFFTDAKTGGEPDVKIVYSSSNAGFRQGPRAAARKTNRYLTEEAVLPQGSRIGWVLMDFPEEEAVRKIIASNQNTF